MTTNAPDAIPAPREAIEEALVVLNDHGFDIGAPWDSDLDDHEYEQFEAVEKAVAAVIQFIADRARNAPDGGEVEPVAWEWHQLMHDSMGGWEHKIERYCPSVAKPEDVRNIRPLYAAPPTPTASPASGVGVESFQSRVQPWLMECFGEMIAGDREERNHRFLEEALELVQSTGCTQSEAHQLVDYVYGRPVGETHQEIGGVMVTLAALCLANDENMHAAGETELTRIWTKVEKIRAKQAAKPKHSPLPEHVPFPEQDEMVREPDAELVKALSGLVTAVGKMRVPQNVSDVALLVMVTLGPALSHAQDILSKHGGNQ